MITYKDSGVDIDRAEEFVRFLKRISKKARPYRDISLPAFSSLLDAKNLFKGRDIVFSFSCDGVGTKLKIAQALNIHHSVGIDLVAMNVNDILCCGARPLVFMDYLGCAKLKPDVLKSVAKGIVRGCQEAGCFLLGGETAEMPGVFRNNEYELAGFCMGYVERKNLIDGRGVREGDLVLGLASSGLHSNGFSLVRKLFTLKEMRQRPSTFLRPTRIYTRIVLKLLERFGSSSVKGIAHITGGGFVLKAPKILPQGLSFLFYKGSWPVPSIFKEIKKRSGLDDYQMYKTFNMGIGLILVVSRSWESRLKGFLLKQGARTYLIGEVIKAKSVQIGGGW